MDYNIWTTMFGEKIPICDMDTEHIENCISMIERSKYGEPKSYQTYVEDYNLYEPYLITLRKELDSR